MNKFLITYFHILSSNRKIFVSCEIGCCLVCEVNVFALQKVLFAAFREHVMWSYSPEFSMQMAFNDEFAEWLSTNIGIKLIRKTIKTQVHD